MKRVTSIFLTGIIVLLAGFTSKSSTHRLAGNSVAGNFLYWSKTPVKSGSLATCYSFAYDSMRLLNFQNIRRSSMEVAGSSGGTYAAITCIGTSPQATALVMVVGSEGNETARVRDRLRDKVAGMIRFD